MCGAIIESPAFVCGIDRMGRKTYVLPAEMREPRNFQAIASTLITLAYLACKHFERVSFSRPIYHGRNSFAGIGHRRKYQHDFLQPQANSHRLACVGIDLVLGFEDGSWRLYSRVMTCILLMSLPSEIVNVVINKVVALSNGRLVHLAHLLLTCKRLYYQCLPKLYGKCAFEVSGPIAYLLAFAVNPRITLTRPEIFHFIKALSVRTEQSWFDKWSGPKPQRFTVLFPFFDTLESLTLYIKADQIHKYINQKAPRSIKTLTLHITPTKLKPCQCVAIIGAINNTKFLLESLAVIIKQSSLAPELPILRPRFDADYTESATQLTKCRVVYGMGLRSFDGLTRSFQSVFPKLKRSRITTNVCIGKIALAVAQKSCFTLSFLRVDNFDAAYVFMDYRDMFRDIPLDLITGFDDNSKPEISLPVLECVVLDLNSFIVSKRWCILFEKLNLKREQEFSTVCVLHDRRCDSLCVLELNASPLRPESQWNYFRVSKDFSVRFFSIDCYLLQKNPKLGLLLSVD